MNELSDVNKDRLGKLGRSADVIVDSWIGRGHNSKTPVEKNL
jgi:hypothetical protein